MRIGHFLASEEFKPDELVRQARLAEDRAVTGVWMSDHFHPWNGEQDQSPFVWTTIDAVLPVPIYMSGFGEASATVTHARASRAGDRARNAGDGRDVGAVRCPSRSPTSRRSAPTPTPGTTGSISNSSVRTRTNFSRSSSKRSSRCSTTSPDGATPDQLVAHRTRPGA